jgi:hypothetical protein
MRSGPESLCSRSAFRPFPRPRLPRRFCRVRPRFARWRIGAGFAVASGLRRRQSRRSRLRRERRNGLERGQPRAPRRPPSRTRGCQIEGNGTPWMLASRAAVPFSVLACAPPGCPARRSWRPVSGGFCVARASARQRPFLRRSPVGAMKPGFPSRHRTSAEDEAEPNAEGLRERPLGDTTAIRSFHFFR